MKIKIITKFNLGDLVVHKTCPGIILMITGLRIYNNEQWDYECEYMSNTGLLLFVFSEYEIEAYESQKGFKV